MPDNPTLSERFKACFEIAEVWRVKSRAAIGDRVNAMRPEILQALADNERLKQELANELHDVEMLCHHLTTVYMYMSDGRVSKPNTSPDVVITLFEDRLTNDQDGEIVQLTSDNERLRSCHLPGCDLLDFSPDGIQKPCNCIEWQLRRMRSNNERYRATIVQLEKERKEAVERVLCSTCGTIITDAKYCASCQP